jgi:hypothetical protein
MEKLSAVRHRLAPYAIVMGLVISPFLSWISHSVVLGTAAGMLIGISFLPFPSWVDGVKAGALIGAVAGALAEAIHFSPARGVARNVIATGYGMVLGGLWGFAVGRFLSRSRGTAGSTGGGRVAPSNRSIAAEPPNNSLEPTRQAGSDLMMNCPAVCPSMRNPCPLPPSGSARIR